MITREELIKKYIEFFKTKGHREIPSSSLIPENDPTVLFTTAGMHPLAPYFHGQKHPLGKRIVNVQKCVRTDDIEEVGDEFHHTFFEMLGNWSFGDYFKEEAIKFSFEFLTSKKWLGIPKERLAVTCFVGDKDAPRDEESAKIWTSLGINKERIVFLPKKNNWWGPAGETGPCGPDTEMFYYIGEKIPKKFDEKDKNWVEIWNDVFIQYEKKKRILLVGGINCMYNKNFQLNEKLANTLKKLNTKKILVVDEFKEKGRKITENLVNEAFSLEEKKITKDNPTFFKELFSKFNLKAEDFLYFDCDKNYVKCAESLGILSRIYESEKSIEKFVFDNLYYYAHLKQKNVDTGMGVERTITVLSGLSDNYLSNSFLQIIRTIEKISGKKYKGNEKAMRIIADHLRASTFILGDERAIKPSNVGQGYVLRRLIRRAIRYGRVLDINRDFISEIAKVVIEKYGDYYGELKRNKEFIFSELKTEEERFNRTLEKGLRKFEEISKKAEKEISGEQAFLLFQSYGFPIEMTLELAKEKNKKVDILGFEAEYNKHKELSRTLSAGIFKSGLGDDSEQTTKLHTATHLLNEALRRVLGKEVKQKGSNINPERLRFDFNFSRKLTEEEIKKIENLVNEKISQGLEVVREEMSLEDALQSGAQAEFGAKYPSVVSVYTILDSREERGWFSKEICTGPHVSNTKDIGKFKIVKEEGVAFGVRRIKAVIA